MTVYLIDGYNVLHQVIGHKQLTGGGQTGSGKSARGKAGPMAGGTACPGRRWRRRSRGRA